MAHAADAVDQHQLRALGLQRGHLGVPGDFAVHIIGVQDDGFADQILLHRVCPGRGHHQRQRHDYGQKQC